MSDKRILTVVDNPVLQARIKSAAELLGFTLEPAPLSNSVRDDILQVLLTQQPQLIIVDLSSSPIRWQPWIVITKTNPSTRRIPVIAVGVPGNDARLTLAQQSGSDAVLGDTAFVADIAGHIRRYARDVEHDREQLSRQCAQAPSAALLQGIHEFNSGAYFEQHETLEGAWRAEPGPIRQLYQGILQIGVAYYQIHRSNYAGAIKMFQRAWQYLNPLPDVCQGVNIAQFRSDAHAVQAELERLGPARIAQLNPVLIKPVQMVNGVEGINARQPKR